MCAHRDRKRLNHPLPDSLIKELKEEKDNISRYIESLIKKDNYKTTQSPFANFSVEKLWCGERDLNPRQPHLQCGALPS